MEEEPHYDAFLSYSTRWDYARARRIEAFLESIHQTPTPAGAEIRALQICRDGSDFRLPVRRSDSSPAESDPVWQIIETELSRCRYLIVLCSPEAVRSGWMAKEIEWFSCSRGVERILPAVTGGRDPVAEPEEVFPAEIRRNALHKGLIWYDLRGLGQRSPPREVRDGEDELVRLASDLLEWNSQRWGPLSAIWQREQLRRRRRQAAAALAAGLILIVAAVFIWLQALRVRSATERARANAWVTAADSASDPVVGALLLAEMVDREAPEEGMRVAQKLSSLPLPQALLRGHTRELRGIAVSPDNAWVLSASWDGTARLWPANGRGDPRTVAVFASGAEKVAFSPDGAWIAVVSRRGEVRLRRLSIQDEGESYPGSAEAVDLAFSPDSRRFAIVTTDGAVRVWRLGASDPILLKLPMKREALCLRWSSSPGEGWIAGEDGTVWAFHLDDGRGPSVTLSAARPGEMAGFEDSSSFRLAAFSGDGSRVAFAAGSQVLVERTDGSSPVLVSRKLRITSIDLNRDGSRLLAADSGATVEIWSAQDGQAVRVFEPGALDLAVDSPYLPSDFLREPTDTLMARFSPDGLHVVTFLGDTVVRVWDTADLDSEEKSFSPATEPSPEATERHRWLRFTLRGHEGVTTAAFSADGLRLITGANDGTIRLWRLSPPGEATTLPHPGPVSSVSFSADGTRLLTVTRDERARLWSEGRPTLFPSEDRLGSITAAIFCRNSPCGVTAHEKGWIRIWNLAGPEPRPVKDFYAHRGAVLGIRLSPREDRILSWGRDGTAQVRRVDGGGKVVTLAVPAGQPAGTASEKKKEITTAELSPEGARAVTGHGDGAVRIWRIDYPSTAPILLSGPRGHTKPVLLATFSPDGNHVLSLSFDGAKIWHSDGGEPVDLSESAKAQEGWGVGSWSPDGKSFAAGSFAGRVWIWRVDGESPPRMLRRYGDLAHIGPVSSLTYDLQGDRLVTTGGMDGQACVWNADGFGEPVVMRQGGALTDARFSPDGELVASASEIGSVLISRVRWRDLVRYLRGLTSATLTVEQRVVLLGETEEEARAAYETSERRFGRTPLPPDWGFEYPF